METQRRVFLDSPLAESAPAKRVEAEHNVSGPTAARTAVEGGLPLFDIDVERFGEALVVRIVVFGDTRYRVFFSDAEIIKLCKVLA